MAAFWMMVILDGVASGGGEPTEATTWWAIFANCS